MDSTTARQPKYVWAATCRWLYSKPASESLRYQRPRRWLVGVFLLVLAAFPIVGWVTREAWAVLLVLVPYIAVSVLLGAATRGVFDRPVSTLDEREAYVRRSIFSEPYMTGAAFGLAGGLIVAVATRVDDGLGMGLVLGAFGLVVGVPSLVLAWTMPDEDHD